MSVGLSDKIRALAKSKYVAPAVMSGMMQFSIRVRDLLGDLQAEGFPGGHTPQVCSALQTSKFLRENGLEITKVEGPPSKMSPTVVVSYRVTNFGMKSVGRDDQLNGGDASAEEDPGARARRVVEKLRGVLKEELAEYGGGEAFLRWIRSEDEDAA